MAFNEKRAEAFAEYTLAVLMRVKKGKKSYFVKRSDLAEILKLQRLHDTHLEVLRRCAIKNDIALADLGDGVLFMLLQDSAKDVLPKLKARDLTDRFEKVHGSEAAEDLFAELT